MKTRILCLLLFVSKTLWAQESKSYILSTEINHQYGCFYFDDDQTFYSLQASLYQSMNLAYNNNFIVKNGPLSGLNKIDINATVNKKIAEKWHLGLTPSISFNNENYLLGIKPTLTHNGHIYKLQFIKDIGFNISQYKQKQIIANNAGQFTTTNTHYNGIFEFGAALAYKFRIQQQPLRLMLSYKGYFINEFVDEADKIYNKRFIDLSTYKLNFNTIILNKLHTGIFLAFQNQFLLSLATSKNPEQNTTYITPTFGYEINYFLGAPDQDGNFSFIF